VLEDDGRVVGYLGVEESVPGVFSLGMAIVPEARGRGGGRALLAALEEHARASRTWSWAKPIEHYRAVADLLR